MAIKEAIAYCKEHTALREFLIAHENEVRENMLWEWDENAYRKVMVDEAREEGREEGRLTTLLTAAQNMVKNMGFSPDKALDALQATLAERKMILAQL